MIGSYLWLVWTNKMKEVHEEGFSPPSDLGATLLDLIDTPHELRHLC